MARLFVKQKVGNMMPIIGVSHGACHQLRFAIKKERSYTGERHWSHHHLWIPVVINLSDGWDASMEKFSFRKVVIPETVASIEHCCSPILNFPESSEKSLVFKLHCALSVQYDSLSLGRIPPAYPPISGQCKWVRLRGTCPRVLFWK